MDIIILENTTIIIKLALTVLLSTHQNIQCVIHFFAIVLICELPEQNLPPLALWCPRNALMYIKKEF